MNTSVVRICIALGLLAGAAPAATLRAHESGPLGHTLTFGMTAAPFPNGKARYRDDTVVVFVPADFVAPPDGRVDIVLFFHGHFDEARKALDGKRLREQLKASGKRAWIVVPQLAERAHDSSGGKLEAPNGVRNLLAEVLSGVRGLPKAALPASARPGQTATVGTVLIAGHSGGFQAAAFAVSRGGAIVHEVVLFDALYGFAARFSQWLAEDPKHRKLVHIYRPGPGNRKVVKWTRTLGRSLSSRRIARSDQHGSYAASPAPAVFVTTTVPHGDIPFAGDLFADILRDSPLR